jgi:PAS domain S-box-containing protein
VQDSTPHSDFPARGSDARFRQSLWIGIVLINTVLVLLCLWVIKDRRDAMEEQANIQTENYARILDGSIAGIFQKIDLALSTVVDEIEHQQRDGSVNAHRLLEFLERQDKHLPETLGLRVSDADGWIQYSATGLPDNTPWTPVDIRDRPHFLALRDAGPQAGLFISNPLISKISQQPVIALARRYAKPDGSFGGIVYAAVPITYFVNKLAQLDLGKQGNSGLWTRTTLIARFAKDDPSGAHSGATNPSRQLKELLDSDRNDASYQAVSGIDGVFRNYHFRKLSDYPIYLVVGLARADYLDQLYRWLLTPISITALLMLGTLLLAGQLSRSWYRLARAQSHMAQLNNALRAQHQETEAAKQQSEMILAAAGEGICGVDLEGRVIFINPSARAMFGWEADEGIGHSLHAMTHHHRADGSEFPTTECPVAATLRDGIQRKIDGDIFWRTDGSSFPVDYTVAALKAGGTIVGAVNIFRNITERLQTEHELAAHRHHLEELVAVRTAALVDTEAKASMILNSSADGLYGIDPQGIIRFANPAASTILGYPSPEYLIGKPAHTLLHHSHPDGSAYPASSCPSYRSLRTGDEVRVTDEVYWRADGQPIPVIYATHPMQKDGQIIGAVTSFIDATEQRAAIEARERALQAAERLARTRSEFIANMSHEIRTPLNGVLGFAAIGLRQCDQVERSREAFTKIQASGKRLLGVINDILDFSKIEAGKLQINQSNFDVRELVRLTVELLEERVEEKGLSLHLDLADDLPDTSLGDEQRIGQVLLNILSNAVKFTDAGTITLAVSESGGQLEFSVADTGIGMSDEQIAGLFTPFYQADASASRKYGGTGLGLVISERLVDLMGGNIQVSSALGQGSCVSFRVPCQAPASPLPAPAEVTDAPAPVDTRPLAGISILAVDDEPINRMVLEEILVDAGARIVLAEGGQEAVDRVREGGDSAFDIILMDLQMPGLGGYAATEIIHRLAPGIPVVAQTAHAFAEERERCAAAGMKAHVTKPFDPDELIDVVRRHALLRGAPRG